MSIKDFSRINHLSLLILIMFIFNVNKALANDADKPASLDGIWSGTIGKQEVLVNFSGSSSTYFYMRYLKNISLYSIASDGEAWVEGSKAHPSATWQLNPVINDEVVGKWLDADAKRTLPIHLARYQTLDGFVTYEEDLGNPSVFSEKITIGKDLVKSGKRYRTISAKGSVSSIELLEDGAQIQLLNTILKNTLRYEIGAYMSCSSPKGMGRDADVNVDYQSGVVIDFWSQSWIVFSYYSSGDCGGAYPFSNHGHSTFNTLSGKSVNLWAWIDESHKEGRSKESDSYYSDYVAPEKLNKIIIAKAIKRRAAWNKNEADKGDCDDVFKENSTYQLSLAKKGLVFSHAFPHVEQACDDDIEIPYETLLPFLTKEGRRSVKLLMAN